MKKLKVILALFIAAIVSIPTFACGDYGMYRLRQLDAQEFLSYQNVSSVTITGIAVHPQDSFHRFFTVNVTEQFRGAEAGMQLVVDGKNSWKLGDAQIGDKMLLFSAIEDGKLTVAPRLTMIVPSETELKRRLAQVDTALHASIASWHQADSEEMNKIYERLRNFGPQLTDGTHEIKQGDNVLKHYTVVNGELNGEFTAFDWQGKVAQKGQFVDGKRAGVWKSFSDGKVYNEEDFGTVTPSVAHLNCY